MAMANEAVVMSRLVRVKRALLGLTFQQQTRILTWVMDEMRGAEENAKREAYEAERAKYKSALATDSAQHEQGSLGLIGRLR